MDLIVTNSTGGSYVVASDLSSKTLLSTGQEGQDLLATGNYKRMALTDTTLNRIPSPTIALTAKEETE